VSEEASESVRGKSKELVDSILGAAPESPKLRECPSKDKKTTLAAPDATSPLPLVQRGRVRRNLEDMKTEAVSQAQLLERLEPPTVAEVPSEETPKPAPEDEGTQVIKRLVPGVVSGGFEVRWAEGAAPESMELQTDRSLGDLIVDWIGSRLRMRTDLSGRVTAWPRFRQGERILGGALKLSEVEPSKVLELCWIPSEERMVELVVQDGKKNQRLLTPMASAVPVSMLMNHLVGWLKLEGECRLYQGERVLGEAEILADLDDGDRQISLRIECVGK
jgi:hypothetical protein